MYKKILIAIAFFAVVFGVFGTVDTVSAASSPWNDPRPSPDTDTIEGNYYEVLQMASMVNVFGDLPGCDNTEFGYLQVHAVEADTVDEVRYVRLRLQGLGVFTDNVGSLAAGIYTTEPGDFGDWVACGKIDTNGILELVGEIPANTGYGVVISTVGAFLPFDGGFVRTWLTVSEFESGGLILDTTGDCGDIYKRAFQVSSQEGVTPEYVDWTYDVIPGSDWQYFLDAPAGMYNIGVQDQGDVGHPVEPFVAFYQGIPIPGPGYMPLNPCLDATKVVTASVDCADQIEGADVFLNIAKTKGFLVDDLTPGVLAATTTVDGVLQFSITPWMYWDLAIVKDDAPLNYFLVAQSFNAIDREITFDLCADGVDWVQPTEDWNWDSASGLFVPPGHLDEHWFDLWLDGFGPIDGYSFEDVFLKVDPGCCGDNEPIDFIEMELDQWQADCPVCPSCEPPCPDTVVDKATGSYPIGTGCPYVDAPVCPTAYFCYDDERLDKWWFYFEPSIVPMDFGEDVLFGVGGIPLAGEVPDYAPIFGDGPFWTDAGVSKLEYVAGETADITYGNPWYDDFGNMLTDVFDGDVLVPPVFGVEAMGDAPADLDTITDIGRYRFFWYQEHGYLGDIFGHESEMVETCCPCNDWDVCDNPCPFLETPHYADGGLAIFAISPADVRMSGHWAWSWVMAMYEKDLTTGVSATMYAPQADVTRAEMAVFLARIMLDLGMAPLGVTTQFVDVPAGYWAYDEILLLKDYNVVNGYPGDGFMPEKTIKRDEMAKMLELAFNSIKTYSGEDYYWDENLTVDPTGEIFADVPAAYWAVAYIEELYFDGLTDGCGYDDGNLYYCPDELVTRAQMAKFVITALQEVDATQGFWPVLAPEK